jgi:hypothetical protein
MAHKIIITLLFCAILSTAQANDLNTALKQATGNEAFTVADPAELKQAQQFFYQSLQSLEAQPNWATLKMEPVNQAEWMIIKESADARRGRGLYAIRHQDAHKTAGLLQVPHAYTDRYTEQLAALLFSEGAFKAVQWNTIKPSSKIAHSKDTADMARYPNTYWQAFTQAFAEQYPQGRIIQINGLAKSGKTKSKSTHKSDLVMSAGQNTSSAWLQQTTSCLQKNLPYNVSLNANNDLSKNAQAQWLQQQHHQGFAHLAISLSLSQKLLNNKELRSKLVSCLTDSPVTTQK